MIEFVTGDMFDIPADGRVNTVNCVGVMGKGVALAFKSRYPNLYREYREVCSRKELKPGGVWIWIIPSLTVFNAATKDHWRDPSRYEWVARSILNLRKAFVATECQSVTLPALGCGNGGLDWKHVRPMVVKAFDDLATKVYVVEPEI